MEWLDIALRLVAIALAIAAVVGGGYGAYRSRQVPALQRDLKFEQEQRDRDNKECQRRVDEMRWEVGKLQGRVETLSSEWLTERLQPAIVAAVKEAHREGNGSG